MDLSESTLINLCYFNWIGWRLKKQICQDSLALLLSYFGCYLVFSHQPIQYLVTWSCFIDCVSNGCCVGSGRWKAWISDVGTIFTERSRSRNRKKAANSKSIWVRKKLMFWTLEPNLILRFHKKYVKANNLLSFSKSKLLSDKQKKLTDYCFRILGLAQADFLQQKCFLWHSDQLCTYFVTIFIGRASFKEIKKVSNLWNFNFVWVFLFLFFST